MKAIRNFFQSRKLESLHEDTRGAGLVEYIILVGLIAIVCIIAYQQFGDAVSAKVDEQKGEVEGI